MLPTTFLKLCIVIIRFRVCHFTSLSIVCSPSGIFANTKSKLLNMGYEHDSVAHVRGYKTEAQLGDLALVNSEDLSHFQELAEKIKQLPEILGWNNEATCSLVGCLDACGLVKMTPTNHHGSGKTWTQMHGMFNLQALAMTRHGFFIDLAALFFSDSTVESVLVSRIVCVSPCADGHFIYSEQDSSSYLIVLFFENQAGNCYFQWWLQVRSFMFITHLRCDVQVGFLISYTRWAPIYELEL